MSSDIGFKIEKLNSNNYAIWKYKVELWLVKEDLWEVTTEDKPDEPSADWLRRDGKAKAHIGLLVDDSQLIHIKGKQTAKEYWEALRCYHERGSLTSKVFLIKRICRLRMPEDGNMEEHISGLINLIDKLTSMGETLAEKWMVAFLLCSLPDSYDTLITALESRPDDDLSFDFVKGRLIHEYKRRLEQTSSDSRSCKSQEEVAMKTCFFCSKPGHIKKFCYLYKNSIRQNNNSAKMVHGTLQEVVNHHYCFKSNMSFNKSKNWYVDSAATCHMCNYKEFFVEMTQTRQNIYLANGSTLPCFGVGEGVIQTNNKAVRIKEVLYVPGLDSNLLSVKALTEKGFSVIFKEKKCELFKDEILFAEASLFNSLYQLNERCMLADSRTNVCIHTWHRRFGHRNYDNLSAVQDMVRGMQTSACSCLDVKCEVCVLGKHQRNPFLQSKTTSEKIMDLIHSDICGPMEVTTPGKKNYFMTFIDDFSKYSIIYLLEKKSDAIKYIKEFVRMTENKFGRRIKIFRSDGGGEYMNNEIMNFFKEEGIKHERTVPYTPQQNGVAERKNRTLVEMTRCMLFDSKMEKKYWGEAVITANYIQNRLPIGGCDKTPYEKWTGNPPNVNHIRTFGCTAYAYVPQQKRQKLDPKSEKLIMVGYSEVSKGYRLLNIETNKITISRDVTFFEVNNPSLSTFKEDEKIEENFVTLSLNNEEEKCDALNSNGCKNKEEVRDIQFEEDELVDNSRNLEENRIREVETKIENNNDMGKHLRRSSRKNKGVLPRRFRADKVTNEKLEEEPKTIKEALERSDSEKWKQAMNDEMESLKRNETWELKELPLNTKPIGNKWVYKIKRDTKGEIVKYKARLVAQGFSQKYGKDYDQVFAPVVKQTTFRTFLAVAGIKGWIVRHYDVKTAYLNGVIEDDIYMYQPRGFLEEGKENMFCKIKKSLYGLKQSARAWNIKLDSVLKNIGFRKGKADPCFYTKKINNDVIHILVYVDDMILASENEEIIKETEDKLNEEFEIKSLGDIQCYLGIEVERVNGTFQIHQENYIKQIVNRFGQGDAKESKYPMDSGYFKLCETDETDVIDQEKYQEIMGCFLYLSVNSRPDIAASVNILCRKVKSPTNVEWREVKRMLRYLKATSNLRLVLGGEVKDELIVYADADWAEDVSDRKSTSGFVFQYHGATVSWLSRKQSLVALSSTEAELISLSEACQEIIWFQYLLEDMDIKLNKLKVFEDNQSVISIVKSDKIKSRTKHIGVKYHFVKETIENNNIDIHYCPTEKMVADILTKPTGFIKLNTFRKMLNLV